MPTVFERIAAKFAYYHAKHVFSRFETGLRDPSSVQSRTLRSVLDRISQSEYSRRYRLDSVRTPADFRKAAPLVSYEDIRPYIDRVAEGDVGALFDPNETVHMFAASSGTTAKQKLIPVTPEFVRQYRRGWNVFGLKMLGDHPAAILRAILQISGKYDERHTASGIPCGAITGLLARTQKGIVRRFYVGDPDIADISDATAKYYTIMRFAVVRDVAFAITANPATLIRLAQVGNDESDRLIRDVRDGTIDAELVADRVLRSRLESLLSPNPARAKELERIRVEHQELLPRYLWNLVFLACWTGGSLGHYLSRMKELWGELPVRDIGLLASEGRVTIPLDDDTPAGVLDTQSGYFEFIPAEQWDSPNADTQLAEDLEVGAKYSVVLTNHAGLIRYRLNDVVLVRDKLHGTPVLEFLHRAGRVASVAGEKITENQVVEAVKVVSARLGMHEFDFLMAPRWSDPPFYQVYCTVPASVELADLLDETLSQQNDEYSSRRKSMRLNKIQVSTLPPSRFVDIDRFLSSRRGSSVEQYKRPYLLTDFGDDDKLLSSLT